jgi:hypothetical protein
MVVGKSDEMDLPPQMRVTHQYLALKTGSDGDHKLELELELELELISSQCKSCGC